MSQAPLYLEKIGFPGPPSHGSDGIHAQGFRGPRDVSRSEPLRDTSWVRVC
jgi:hypothetical protein